MSSLALLLPTALCRTPRKLAGAQWVGLILEGSEVRLSQESALFHHHREAGVPREKPTVRQSHKADVTALLRPNQEPDVGEIHSESRCAIEATQ